MYYEVSMALAFLLIFLITHVAFNNGRLLCVWMCKLILTTYIWFVLWVLTQMHQLPEWQRVVEDSWKSMANGTLFQHTGL